MKHGPPPSLKNTTDIDFGRDTWIKFYLKDYSLFHLCNRFKRLFSALHVTTK